MLAFECNNEYPQIAEKDAETGKEDGWDSEEERVALAGNTVPDAIGRLGIEKVATPTHKIRNVEEQTDDPGQQAVAYRLFKRKYLLIDAMVADIDVS